MCKLVFQNNYYYHIYNRGVDKRKIFLDNRDYARFIKYIRIFIFKEKYSDIPEAKPPLGRLSLLRPIDIICYCFNPNHFHFLFKQNIENGVSAFMHYLSTSYTMYFNAKYRRSGSLFQGTYKAVEIKSDEHLINISAYINANAKIHGITNNPSKYLWCSYPDYLNIRNGTLIGKEILLKKFNNIKHYQEFVEKNSFNIRQDRRFAKLIIE